MLTSQAGAINPETITQADMEYACEQARILDFIKSLPEGFETDIAASVNESVLPERYYVNPGSCYLMVSPLFSSPYAVLMRRRSYQCSGWRV
jgi:hypothetical protein